MSLKTKPQVTTRLSPTNCFHVSTRHSIQHVSMTQPQTDISQLFPTFYGNSGDDGYDAKLYQSCSPNFPPTSMNRYMKAYPARGYVSWIPEKNILLSMAHPLIKVEGHSSYCIIPMALMFLYLLGSSSPVLQCIWIQGSNYKACLCFAKWIRNFESGRFKTCHPTSQRGVCLERERSCFLPDCFKGSSSLLEHSTRGRPWFACKLRDALAIMATMVDILDEKVM